MAIDDQISIVTRPQWVATKSGLAYIASATIDLSGKSTGNVRHYVLNPAGSDKRVVFDQFRAYTSQDVLTGRMRINPTLNLPTAGLLAIGNMRPAKQADMPAVAKVYAKYDAPATTALGGGIDTGVDFVADSSMKEYSDPIMLDPGVSVGLNFAITKAVTGIMILTLRWYESEV